MSAVTASAPGQDESYLTKAELAAMLRVTPRTITNYVREKLVPAPTKVGRKALWSRSEVRKHLAAQAAPEGRHD